MTSLLHKTVTKCIPALLQGEGQGAKVRRSIGNAQLRHFDPFLLFDEFAAGKPAGFPDHPHRGFETVTYVLTGAFHHEDFKGHSGRLGPGDVQWMTAGKGIVHAEIPASTQVSTGLQLWVNLPAKHKMKEPQYQELSSLKIPVYQQEGVSVKVIAGQSGDVQASIGTHSPLMYIDITLEKEGATYVQSIPEGFNTFAYVLESNVSSPGTVLFSMQATSDSPIPPHSMVLFSTKGKAIEVRAVGGPARILLIGGEPIGEPIAQYGPFVMNTAAEIQQAFEDYRNSKNGFQGAAEWESEIAKRMHD